MTTVDLIKYNNDWYNPGNLIKRLLWIIISAIFFESFLPFPSRLKCYLLRAFGAQIGNGVTIKPRVKIKYPWHLLIGNYTWLGEQCWIDDLTDVRIGNNVCISQGAFIETGNHNWSKQTFDLIIRPIIIEDGAWIGAKALILPGSKVREHAVVTSGCVFSGEAKAFGIYSGNPAKWLKHRHLTT